MLVRISLLAVVAGALVALTGPALSAADKVHEATVVKAGDGKVTLTFKGDPQKHTHDVARDAKITLDGKAAKIEDLKEGFPVKLTMNEAFVVTSIEAKSR